MSAGKYNVIMRGMAHILLLVALCFSIVKVWITLHAKLGLEQLICSLIVMPKMMKIFSLECLLRPLLIMSPKHHSLINISIAFGGG